MNDISNTIRWADKSYNPIIGCDRSCTYCYARVLNQRFSFIKDFEHPEFMHNAFYKGIEEMKKAKKPYKIFVCSMADIFCSGVQEKWVHLILNVACMFPNLEFMFLTKIPQGYSHYKWPSNCTLGVTCEEYNIPRIETMRKLEHTGKKFISIEPILGSFEGVDLSCFDQVIVGAMSGIKPVKPLPSWIKGIEHPNIFWKDSILPYLNK